MSTLGKAVTVVLLLFGTWFAIIGIVMDEARNYIRRMLREASIYESKPGHYMRV